MGRPRKAKLPIPSTGRETGIRLDAALVEGFVREFLWHRFDGPKVTPKFHKELWSQWCDPHQFVVDAAPRGHAKTTAGTHSFGLAAALFGFRDYIWLISSTEEQSAAFLGDIQTELTENEALIETFNIRGLSKDNETELICHSGDRVFKFLAKGAEQKLRGVKWRNKRPNLVIVDDLEEDEQVMNSERREKLRRWFMNALLPAGSDDCLFRVLGTVLHLDALLERLLTDPMWLSRRYSAHASYDDFSQILWPEKYPEVRLRALRASFARQGNASGYSQEYLNSPVADVDQYFKVEWFQPLDDADRDLPMRFYSGIDFAISDKQKADFTAIVTVGVFEDGRILVVDVRRGRWDGLDIIEEMFAVHEQFEPELFIAEDGAIRKSIGSFLDAEMMRRNLYLNILPRTPVDDKTKRAKSIQARMRAGGVLFDQDTEWYEGFKEELTTFPRGKHDDQVDAFAWIGLELKNMTPSSSLVDLEEEDMVYEELMNNLTNGRCPVTGY